MLGGWLREKRKEPNDKIHTAQALHYAASSASGVMRATARRVRFSACRRS